MSAARSHDEDTQHISVTAPCGHDKHNHMVFPDETVWGGRIPGGNDRYSRWEPCPDTDPDRRKAQ